MLFRSPTLSEYSSLIGGCDIVIDGGANENWSLPSFHATALGKHMVGIRANGVAEWANDENAILIETNGKEPCYDDRFFRPGPFSQGEFMTWDEEQFKNAMLKVLDRFNSNPINTKGLELKDKFKWSSVVDSILESFN